MQERTDNYRRHQESKKAASDICLKEDDKEKNTKIQEKPREEEGSAQGSSQSGK